MNPYHYKRNQPYESTFYDIIAAGMAKYIHTSTLALLEKILGATQTSRARKKARLAFVELDTSIQPYASTFPKTLAMPGNLVTVQPTEVFGKPDQNLVKKTLQWLSTGKWLDAVRIDIVQSCVMYDTLVRNP
jgi:hypothetical protein